LVNKLSFKQCVKDPCVYVKKSIVLAVYVVDMLLIGKGEVLKEGRGRAFHECF
jgi:hypothetical protein